MGTLNRPTARALPGILLLAVSILPVRGEAPAPVEGIYEIGLPGIDWTLTVNIPGFEVEEESTRPDNSGSMFRGTIEENGIIISLFLEREKKARSSIQCRDKYWKRGKKSPVKKSGIRLSESGKVAVVEYTIKAFQGIEVNQKHVHAFMGAGKICVDLHLSQVSYNKEDALVFSSIIKSLQIKEK